MRQVIPLVTIAPRMSEHEVVPKIDRIPHPRNEVVERALASRPGCHSRSSGLTGAPGGSPGTRPAAGARCRTGTRTGRPAPDQVLVGPDSEQVIDPGATHHVHDERVEGTETMSRRRVPAGFAGRERVRAIKKLLWLPPMICSFHRGICSTVPATVLASCFQPRWSRRPRPARPGTLSEPRRRGSEWPPAGRCSGVARGHRDMALRCRQ
jgi:hypothetical protein